MNSLILSAATWFMLPLLLLFSVFLLLRGHNEPGGGFSGGLVAACAFVLYAFAFGVPEMRRALPTSPQTLLGTGLLSAIAAGATALAFGRPLLTGMWFAVPVPGFGDVDMGTPLLFDVGVFLVVIGVALAIILPLMEE